MTSLRRLEGFIDIYSHEANLPCFVSGHTDLGSTRGIVIFVGGLTDYIHSKAYIRPLSQMLKLQNATLVQPVLSSAGMGYGTSSLRQDAAEITKLLRYLHNSSCTHSASCPFVEYEEVEGSILGEQTLFESDYLKCGMPPVCLIGHSTGCQDALFLPSFLLSDQSAGPGRNLFLGKLRCIVLQGPVSDRELAESTFAPSQIAIHDALSAVSHDILKYRSSLQATKERHSTLEMKKESQDISTNLLDILERFDQSDKTKFCIETNGIHAVQANIEHYLKLEADLQTLPVLLELFQQLAKIIVRDDQIRGQGQVGMMPPGTDLAPITASRFLALTSVRGLDDYFSADLFFDEAKEVSCVNRSFIRSKYNATQLARINALVVASLNDEYVVPNKYADYEAAIAAIAHSCLNVHTQDELGYEQFKVKTKEKNEEVPNVMPIYDKSIDDQIAVAYGIKDANHALDGKEEWQIAFIDLIKQFLFRTNFFLNIEGTKT